MTDVATALDLLKNATTVQDVIDIADGLSAAAVNPAEGAVLYSGNVDAASAHQIAVNIANRTGLNIIDATPRAQFLANQDVEKELARIFKSLNQTATPAQIEQLVTNELYGGNATSLWGRASADFISSIKGAVTVVAEKVNPARIFGAVEIPALLQGLANNSIRAINGIEAASLPTASSDLIGSVQSSFMSALAKGGAFSAAATGTTGQVVSSEALAALKLPTTGAQTAAQYTEEGLAKSTAPVLETAAAGEVESLLAVGGSGLFGLLGRGLKLAGSPFVTALIIALTPTPAGEGEDELVAKQNATWLALDTPVADQTQLATTTNGTTSATVPFNSADGTTHNNLAITADPSAGTAVVAVVSNNDESLTISSVRNGASNPDDQITETLPAGEYDDQIAVTTNSTGTIDFRAPRKISLPRRGADLIA